VVEGGCKIAGFRGWAFRKHGGYEFYLFYKLDQQFLML
jgi:hypothetical protein